MEELYFELLKNEKILLNEIPVDYRNTVKKMYDEWKGQHDPDPDQSTIFKDFIQLIDQTTGDKYKITIDNGSLYFEEVITNE